MPPAYQARGYQGTMRVGSSGREDIVPWNIGGELGQSLESSTHEYTSPFVKFLSYEWQR